MSGGSYSYLYCKSFDQLVDDDCELEEMANRLAGLGYAEDAARETKDMLLLIRRTKKEFEDKMLRLADVWQAIEWWDSGDWGEDQAKEALAKYRAERAQDIAPAVKSASAPT